jgi:hypothetical protein
MGRDMITCKVCGKCEAELVLSAEPGEVFPVCYECHDRIEEEFIRVKREVLNRGEK